MSFFKQTFLFLESDKEVKRFLFDSLYTDNLEILVERKAIQIHKRDEERLISCSR